MATLASSHCCRPEPPACSRTRTPTPTPRHVAVQALRQPRRSPRSQAYRQLTLGSGVAPQHPAPCSLQSLAPAAAGCWLGIRLSQQGKPVPRTGPAWPRGKAAPAPSTCTILFQLVGHSSRVDDYLSQSLQYLRSPQEPLQEAAIRFIGESQPHGSSVPHSSLAAAPAAAESATWLQGTAGSEWAWSACGGSLLPSPTPCPRSGCWWEA